MKHYLFGSVAAAALLASSAAFAQQATGLYVSAGVGANWLENTDFDEIGGPGQGSTDLDVGPVGVVALGYDWGYLRGEAELGIRNNDGEFEFCTFIFCNDNEGHVRTISAMANLLVDFDLGPVTIYGGGGLGIANIEWYNNNGFVDGSSFDTVFAYQGIAGAAFNVTQQLAVTAEYRYFSSFEDPEFTEFDTENFGFSNHSALIGVRYTFAPPAPAAVVEVQKKSYLVFFDFDRSDLTPDARSIIATAAADALAGGSPRLDVTGHADRSGSDAYNQALSIRRATSVQNELIANGVPADIIVIRGAGESEPLVPTADGVREPQNRRVEIVIN
jgi:outer membrane protein OmpA-like peptidoglycan-associated protein